MNRRPADRRFVLLPGRGSFFPRALKQLPDEETGYLYRVIQTAQIPFRLPSGKVFPVSVVREDLRHGLCSGNKYWKLKHNLAEAKRLELPILTFGGAYSNHIYATAAAGRMENIPTVGIIRGEEPAAYSPTLRFAQAQGMHLHFVSREAYRHKQDSRFLDELRNRFGDFYLIPEGGSNALGLKGCEEWGALLAGTADIYVLAAGTGTTAAGIAKALLTHQPGAEVWAFSALKSGDFLKDEAENITGISLPNLRVIIDYPFGGYAKHTPELLAFIQNMETEYGLPLEQVYTAKTLYGLLDMVQKGMIPSGKKVCFIHTGGLQGKTPG